jgi:hypothetical protein
MQNDQYLPLGLNIGGHYEIVKLLGEDDFEIVYLVKDIHRLETNFILKELFLKEFSFRNENIVYTLEKSKDIFEEMKQGIINDVNILQKNRDANRLQTYGYFEENGTIYTIMEFSNNSSLDSYLKIQSKREKEDLIPQSTDKNEESENEPKSFIFLKMLIVSLVVLIGLGVYAYKIIEDNKNKAKENVKVVVADKHVPTPIPHPPLTDRVKRDTQQEEKSRITPSIEEEIPTPTKTPRYIPEIPEGNDEYEIIEEETFPIIEEQKRVEEPKETHQNREYIPEIKRPKEENIVKEEVVVKKEETIPTTQPTPKVSHHLPKENRSKNRHLAQKFNRESVRSFLENFVSISGQNSIDALVSLYDTHVNRYFRLNNVIHADIYRDKVRYNRKWVHREFTLIDFEILNIYVENDKEYCDIRKNIRWKVSTKNSETASGTSKTFMTIRYTKRGFKVKSIYTIR